MNRHGRCLGWCGKLTNGYFCMKCLRRKEAIYNSLGTTARNICHDTRVRAVFGGDKTKKTLGKLSKENYCYA